MQYLKIGLLIWIAVIVISVVIAIAINRRWQKKSNNFFWAVVITSAAYFGVGWWWAFQVDATWNMAHWYTGTTLIVPVTLTAIHFLREEEERMKKGDMPLVVAVTLLMSQVFGYFVGGFF